MSLVIVVWDKSVGIAVSEGRACVRRQNGEWIPVLEDRCKITRLRDGSVLGVTGDICEPLREAIKAEAEAGDRVTGDTHG